MGRKFRKLCDNAKKKVLDHNIGGKMKLERFLNDWKRKIII